MEPAGHVFEEHTSEVQVRLWAPSKRELFVEAALALAELMAESPVKRARQATESITLEAATSEELLVDWLNELLFRTEMHGHLYDAIQIDELTDRKLSGAVGAGDEQPRIAVKAATFHGLHIAPAASGYTATVILDV